MKKLITILLTCILLAATLFVTGCDYEFPDLEGDLGDFWDGFGNGGGDKGDGEGDNGAGNVGGDIADNGGEGNGNSFDWEGNGRPGGNGDQSHGGGGSGAPNGNPNGNGGNSGYPNGNGGGTGGSGNTGGGTFEYETYTVTFVADGDIVGMLEFNTRDIGEAYLAFILEGKDLETLLKEYGLANILEAIAVPEVPAKQCCDGRWGDCKLEEKNITVYAVYEEHHTLNNIEAKEPKCNEKGNIEYYACSECGKYFSDAEGKNEITDKDSVVINEVACSYDNCVCIWCGNVQHTLVHYERVEPKCNEKGNIEYYACSECGRYFSDAEGENEITDKDSVVIDEVDCSYDSCVCIWCGNVRHTLVHYEKVEPKCNAEGNVEYWHCDKCGNNYSDAEGENKLYKTAIDKVDCCFVNKYCKWCGASLSDRLEYELSADESYYTVVGIGGYTDTELVIPNEYNGKPVKAIGRWAFWGCDDLTSVTIPDSVTSIGSYAFRSCSGLTNIVIPDSVTSIGSEAFIYCSGLESITVAEGNSKYHSSGNCLIETESKTLILGCKNSIIPSDGSVTVIGGGAFEDCSSLTSITIPDSVTRIGDEAFL